MPSPKDGKAGNLVAPAAPRDAKDADVADPGEVEKVKVQEQALGTGKYGEVPVREHKPMDSDTSDDDAAKTPPEKKAKHWIVVKLIDADGLPVAGEAYKVTLPNGSVSSGTLDTNGMVRIDSISDEGDCKVTFPNIAGQSWGSA